jgi:hypothetical protein
MSKDRACAGSHTDRVPLPPGHYAQLTAPGRRVRGRERLLVAGGVAMLAAIVVAVIVSFTSVQRQSRHGCIDVSAATVIGGSELYRCGQTARALCAVGGSRSTLSFSRALEAACRGAGLPGPATVGS